MQEQIDTEYWAQKLSTWSKDPYQWCKDVVWTKDAVDESNPFKRFPADYKYLEIFDKVWMGEKRIAVPKSRRMFMSWNCIALHLWDAMFHNGKTIGLVSKKEDDSNELIQRALFILENIKEEDWPKQLRPAFTSKFNEISFPQLKSVINGYPQGADQLRQFTFSRLMFDEMAFWEKAKDAYAAAKPTLDGGGAVTAISSAAPGFFRDLVFDSFDGEDSPPEKTFFPAEGVQVHKNKKNKFVVFQLHYSADVKKRSDSYREALRTEMPYSDYMREYEISWETYQGRPVYTDWNKSFHGNKIEEHPDIGLPLILGLDQGLTPALTVMQAKEDEIVVLREYTAENMGAEKFKAYCKSLLRVHYPQWANFKEDFILCIDPTAFNRRDVDERTYASVWAIDFTVCGGENGFEKRKQSVEDRLIRVKKGRPTFRVNLMNCPVLVRGFDGEYHYPDKMFDKEPEKPRPLKNFAANVHDALQYGLTGFMKKMKRRRTSVPKPTYNFTGGVSGTNSQNDRS
jgi:hypothetical protein